MFEPRSAAAVAPAPGVRGLGRALLLLLCLAGAASVAAAVEILPFTEVEVGMTGTGRTVWSGDKVEEFKVEVVGRLEGIQPGRNLILVRCSGGVLAQTGIAQGMSGSPIFLRGRLAGALAYSWGFAQEPVAGVTPVEEMLRIPGADGDTSVVSRGRATWTGGLRDLPTSAAEASAFFAGLRRRAVRLPAPEEAALRPLALPLHAAGFPAEVLGGLEAALGAVVVPAGGGSATRGGSEPTPALEPGSAVGAQLVRGDLELTAVGTVTAVEEGRVLAFGHPFLNLGRTAMPLTSARVHLVVPSLYTSFKIASPGEVVGEVRQDRSAGLLGALGPGPRMIPVRMEVTSGPGEPRRYAFELVDDPLLTPLLMNFAVLSVLSAQEKDLGPMTLRLRQGSSIQIAGYPPVELANFYAGDFAAPLAAGLPAFLLHLLMNNEFAAPRVEGINLLVDFLDERRSAQIEEVWAERVRVRPGETVGIQVNLRPFRGEVQQRRIELELPREIPRGRLLVRIGDGLTLSRLETRGEPSRLRPRDLDQLVWLMNQIRSFNRIYANASVTDRGLETSATILPNLPPSVAQVLMMPQSQGSFSRTAQRAILEESVETEFGVTGYHRIVLEVVP